MYLSLSELSLKFGLPPEEISLEEYQEKARAGWVEWVPAAGDPSHGHVLVAVTPPGTSHMQAVVSRLVGRKITLG